MERYNKEEKEMLMRVMKEIRYDPERIPPNLRYIDRKKVRAATVNINKIVSLIKTETITETNSVLRAAGKFVAEMVAYKSKGMAGIISTLEGIISKLERKLNITRKCADMVYEELR